MSNNNFVQKFKTIVEKVGGTKKAAEISGVSSMTISRWLDASVEPKLSSIFKLTDYAGVSIDWLFNNIEELENKKIYSNSGIADDFEFIKGYNVEASAGFGSINENENPSRYLAFRKKWLNFKGFHAKDLVVIYVKGDSMQPTIYDHDTILINTANKKLTDGLIYVIRQDSELLVKRLQRIPSGIRLISDNKIYREIDIKNTELHNFEIIGQVVHVSHDL